MSIGGELASYGDTSTRFASCNARLAGTYFPRDRFRCVYVVGDVHGDFTALVKCLRISRVMERRNGLWVWCAPPRTAVVLLGDTVDRFRRAGRQMFAEHTSPDGFVRTGGERRNEELHVVLLLDSLSQQAERNESAVFRLFGNHEFMNYTDNLYNYVTPYALNLPEDASYDEIVQAVEVRAQSFKHGPFRRYIGSCQPKAIIQIGPTVMCHGGIDDRMWDSPAVHERMHETGLTLFELANQLATAKWESPDVATDPLFETLLNNSITRSIEPDDRNWLYTNRINILPVAGILWDDQLSDSQINTAHGHVCDGHTRRAFQRADADAASRHGVERLKHVCVAHCQQTKNGTVMSGAAGDGEEPSDRAVYEEDDEREVFRYSSGGGSGSGYSQGINTECGGMVWRVDVGMSRAFRFNKSYFIEAAGKTEEEYYNVLEAQRPQVLRIVHQLDGTEDFAVLKYKGNYSHEYLVFTGLGDDEQEPF
jgi:hypothetical protein